MSGAMSCQDVNFVAQLFQNKVRCGEPCPGNLLSGMSEIVHDYPKRSYEQFLDEQDIC